MNGRNPVLCGIALGLALAANALARDLDLGKLPPPSDQKNLTFTSNIKPIFDNSCVRCHSGEKPRGRLRLSTLAEVMKGGEDGRVIKPGDSAHSMLVQNIGHLGDRDDWMPPPNNKEGVKPLTAEQIGLIRAWIDQGAK